MKKVLSVLMTTVLILGIFAGNLSFAENEKTINILHVNDVHARVEGDDEGLIGYGRLKTCFETTKKENKNTLLVDAGDVLHGTTFANISKGENMIKLMNEIGFSLSVPGNHDFNYGYNQLLALSKKADFPILAANVKKSDGTQDLEANKIIEVDKVKIGFFGLATPETKFKSSPKNTEGVDFADYIETAKEQVKKLQDEKADVIVAVTHLGLDESSKERSDILAEKVEGIDLIIDGHSHTELPQGKKINNTLVAQTGCHLHNIGKVTIMVSDGKVAEIKAELIPFDAVKDLEKDAKIEEMIEMANKENEKSLGIVVGKTANNLDGEREQVRTGETNLGNLITDAMRESISADVALTNGGGIRATISEGDITVGDILTAFPFTNFVVGIEVTGQDIKDALEHGVDSAPEPAGKFPHVSGMTFKYDSSKPAGERVTEVLVKGEKLDLEKTYKLATNDFVSIGGDDYKMFAGKTKFAENALLSDVLIEKIKSLPNATCDYKVENRIVNVNNSEIEVPAKPEVPTEKPEKSDIMISVSSQAILLNGESVKIPAYLINNNNYFMLRDLAAALKGTSAEFDVAYDAEAKTVKIIKGQAYKEEFKYKELSNPSKTLVSPQKLLIDNDLVDSIKAYLVDGSNFFQLRDLGNFLGFKVDYDQNQKMIIIDTVELEKAA